MFEKIYNKKLINVEVAVSMIKSNDIIVTGLGASEPQDFLNGLSNISSEVSEVIVTTCLPMKNYNFFTDPKYRDNITMEGWFYSGGMRKAHPNKNVSFIPNHLHLSAVKRLHHKKPNIFVGNVSSMDKHGYFSLGLSNVYEKRIIEKADIVILEVNKNVPRTFGDNEIHINDIDFLIDSDYDLPVLPVLPFSEKDRKIGSFISEFIYDGDCIQLGIGGIPNAVADALKGKNNLGIHTEMLTDGMKDLVNSGSVNCKKKNFHKGKIVATFALGSKELYDFIDDNPIVQIRDGHWVNDPYIIGQNDNMVSINTTIEIDLTGQCCSESIGNRQFSGTGGQADTAIGAQRSRNGRSFIALYSTAFVKDPLTGKREEISKIVPMLKEGAAVSLSRNDVDYVVTEYGIAKLRGTSVKERVKRLIGIAHPKFRDELSKKSAEFMIW